MGVSPKEGVPYWGSQIKGYSALGFILGVPLFGETTILSLMAATATSTPSHLLAACMKWRAAAATQLL